FAMSGMHLEVSGVHDCPRASIQVDVALGQGDAADDLPLAIGHRQLPAITCQMVEGEEVGRPIHTETDVTLHRARQAEVDEPAVVTVGRLTDPEWPVDPRASRARGASRSCTPQCGTGACSGPSRSAPPLGRGPR